MSISKSNPGTPLAAPERPTSSNRPIPKPKPAAPRRINRISKVVQELEAKEKNAYGRNVPVCSAEMAETITTAREVHQHNVFPWIVNVVDDRDAITGDDVWSWCLHCGEGIPFLTAIKTTDNAAFQDFKNTHCRCPRPKTVVGFFNREKEKGQK